MTRSGEAEAVARFGAEGTVLPRLVRSWAAPRPLPMSVGTRLELPPELRVGAAPSAELATWIRLFEAHALEAADPAEAELRAPGDLPDFGALLAGGTGPSAVADLFGILTASVVFAQQDELAYLASVAGTAAGVSRVYLVHPEDWGVHPSDASIAARLFRLEEAARAAARPFGRGAPPAAAEGPMPPDPPAPATPPPCSTTEAPETLDAEQASLEVFERLAHADPLPSHLDPGRLGRRVDWLVRAWLGLPLAGALDRAPDLAELEEEAPLLGHHPHLALYWLFATALLDEDGTRFRAALAAARDLTHPFVDPARDALRRWRRGEAAELGPLDGAAFEAMREAARTHAGGRGRARGPRGALEADPANAEFLELFDHLATPAPGPWRDLEGLALEDALAERARPAHRLLLDRALSEGSTVSDHHPRAGRGRILARATIASDLAELDRALADAGGTERFGPRRRDELWRAIARFRDPEAHARLARGASAFAREAEDWLRSASKVPWEALLDRDAVETHDLVARFTEGVPHTVTTAPLIVEAARAARRHRVARAVPGLRRAVAGGVGRIDDGGRGEIAWAIAELDPEAPIFLRVVADILRADWEEAEDEEEAERAGWALAVILGPLLSVAPSDRTGVAAAAALLGRAAVRLGPGSRPRAEVLEAVRALARGIGLGEVRLLEPPLRALARLRPLVGAASRAAHARFRSDVEIALDELGER